MKLKPAQVYLIIGLGAPFALWGILRTEWIRPGSVLIAAEQSFSETVPTPAPSLQSDFKYVGTASCAASNCHGGDANQSARIVEAHLPQPDPLSPRAYSIWIQNDPHAWAYSTLLTSKSREISEQLRLEVPAHHAPECLSCHSPQWDDELTATNRFTTHDGVGCESCHGPAEKWLEPHKWRPWRTMTAARKEDEFGFRDTNNLGQRARMCAECHVGGAGRDVNHDLIAAGHPRMTFELAAYHANLPRHWSREEVVPAEAIDARLWQIGQVVSAEAALQLLGSRARDPKASWPEFAEYDCYACHHDLLDERWRRSRGAATGRPGSFPWGTWHFALLPLATDGNSFNGSLAERLDELRVEMSQPFPNRESVADLARQAQQEIVRQLDPSSLQTQNLESESVVSILERILAQSRADEASDWDTAAQRYLAVAAVHVSAAQRLQRDGKVSPEEVRQVESSLDAIRRLLLFSQNPDSAQYASPRGFGSGVQERVGELFESILDVYRQ